MFQRRKRNSCIFFRQRRGGKIDSLFCLAVPQDAGPGCTTTPPPPPVASSADFLSLSLSLSPSPRFLPNCNRAPLSPVGLRPWPGTASRAGDVPALGMCRCWAISSPVSWSAPHVCLQRGDQCWPRAALGSCKEAPCPGEGAIPCVRPGLGGGVDMHRKLGADRWVLGAGGHRPGGGWQAPGEAISGAIKSSAPSQSHLRTARAGEQGASGNPLGAVAAHSLSFLVFKMRSHGAGSVRLHR